MRVISRKTLKEFWEQRGYRDSESHLKAWLTEVEKAEWSTPQDIKDKYRNASFVANNRAVFNIKGNNYRLIVQVQYTAKIVWIKFIGTHDQYDEVDATTVNQF